MKKRKERSRTEYSVLNIVAGLGGYALSVILSFFNRMVFTRCMPPAYLGVSGLFTNILSMLSLAELGISGAIVYALYKPLAENDEDKIAAIVRLFGKAYRMIGLFIAIAGLCVLPFLELLIGKQTGIVESIHIIYLFYLFNTAVSYLFTYRSTLLVAAQKNYIVTGLNYLILSIQEVVQAIFLFWKRDYIGYLIIQTVFSVGYYILISHIAVKQYPYIVSKNVKNLPDDERKSIFSNVKDLMLYKVAGVLVNGTDNIIITYFKGLTITGLTSNYTLLTNTLNTLLCQVFDGITASVGNHNVTVDSETKYEMYKFLNMINFWLYGWATLGIIFCASDIVNLLFGSEYILPMNIPIVLALSFYVSGVTNVAWTYKQAFGLFHYGRFIQLLTATINISLSILLGRFWGLFGILLATVIARFLTHHWYTPYVIYKYGFKRKFTEAIVIYFKYLIIVFAAGCVCAVILPLVQGMLFVKVILKMIICSVIVNIMFYIFLVRTPEFVKFKYYLLLIIGKIFNISRKDNLSNDG